jgi:signal transduction histidine kinase
LVAAAGAYQWQQRRGRLHEQYWQAEHALCQRIATDLHDDGGNLLTQISMHSSLLRETPHSPVQTAARLDALAAASRQAAQQMSDVVWGLDAEHLRLGQLLDRMRDHA